MSKHGWWVAGGALLGGLIANMVIRDRRRTVARQRARNHDVRVLVVGAGVVGSTYAAHLARTGMEVTLLARGQRLQELVTRGLEVRDVLTRRRQVTAVHLASMVSSQADYDLVIVAVPYPEAAEALERVRPLADKVPVLVMGNNAVGVVDLAQHLGEPQLLLGFPATSGARRNAVVFSLPLWLNATVIGESDGAQTQRLAQAAAILRWAGLRVHVEHRIVPWLRTHAAMLAVLAGCIYRNGGRVREWARHEGEVRLYRDALCEAYAVLQATGTAVTPSSELATFQRPPWLSGLAIRLATWMPWFSWCVDRYMADAVVEMAALYDQLLATAQRGGVQAPTLALLREHLPPAG